VSARGVGSNRRPALSAARRLVAVVAEGAEAAEAARQLAARLSERLARNGQAGVVEPGADAEGRPTVELRLTESTAPSLPGAAEGAYRWVVDRDHLDSQFRDLSHRIDLLLVGRRRAPAAVRTPTGAGWCEWE